MATYDIAIAGCGPAASIFAILVAKHGRKVVVIDKRNLESDEYIKQKTCGGLLSPDAQKVMASLGLSLANDVLADPQLFFVKTIDLKTKRSRCYQRFYLNMDREKFDRYLVSLIPESVDKIFSTVIKDISYEKGIYHIETDNNTVIDSKMMIGCDGAGSIVRKKIFNDEIRGAKRYYAIQKVYRYDDMTPGYYAFFDNSITDYAGWAFVKDKKLTIGMAFKQKEDGNTLFDQAIQRIEKQSIQLGEPIKKEGALLLRPCSMPKVRVENDQTAFLLGEAAGYISPSSAEGISYAFTSAIMLAKALDKNKNTERLFTLYTFPMRFKILLKVFKSKVINNEFLRNAIMISKIKSID